MKKLSIISLAAAALVGCSTAETDLAHDSAVQITSSISTRASGEAWAEGDKIGVYMNESEGALGALGANVLYTTEKGDGAFSSTTPLYYPMEGSSEMLAYYPYNEALSDATSYAVDVTDQSSHPAIDLMSATAKGIEKSADAVKLTFSHKLANIVITIAASDDVAVSDLAGIKMTLTGTKATANYDLTTDAITLAPNATDIDLQVTPDGTRAEGIVIPQELSGAELKLYFAGNETPYSTAIETLEYEGGKQYQYDATVTATEIVIADEVKIAPWGDGSGDGDAETVTSRYDMKVDENGNAEIYTAEGLKAFADLVNGVVNTTAKVDFLSNFNFSETPRPTTDGRLMRSVDLSSICKAGANWTPIGSFSNQYAGTFDGNNLSVVGLYIDDETLSYQGLFGYVSRTTIQNLSVSGHLLCNKNGGLLFGSMSEGSIINCHSAGDVGGHSSIGGVAGYVMSIDIIASSNSCSVTTKINGGEIGGVVGHLNGNMVACYNTGEIKLSNDNSFVGGVAGLLTYEKSITACYNIGAISGSATGTKGIGGVVGAKEDSVTLSDSYWVDSATTCAEYGIGGELNNNNIFTPSKNDAEGNAEAEKLSDIAALNAVFSDLNDAIETWNKVDENNYACEYMYATGADGDTPPRFVPYEEN